MMRLWFSALLSVHWFIFVASSDCNGDPNLNYTCPANGGFFCELSGSLAGSIIIRCIDGCPVPGNCDDNLFCYPSGTSYDKQDALCYQDSPTAGNAQCTSNCVNVTRVDGSVFYPIGCVSSALTLLPSATACDQNSYGATPTLPAGIIQPSAASTASTASTSAPPSVTNTGPTTSSAVASPSSTSKSSGASISADTGLGRFLVEATCFSILVAMIIQFCC